MRRWLAFAVLVIVVALSTWTSSHPLAPVVLQLTAGDDGIVTATLKEPTVRPRGAVYAPRWPVDCDRLAGPERLVAEDDARLTRYRLRCRDLVGTSVGVAGLDGVTAILRITHANGRVHQALLDEQHPTVTIPAATAPGAIVGEYLAMGTHHLLAGLDHLLFILGLMVLVRDRRRLVVALTTFTLGHSLTLAAAVLGVVHLPTGPIEIGIALSLLLLALQITTTRGGESPREPRRPWLSSLVFGLLHGFGFAGGLTEAGLPAADIPLALLGFNLGVELGQLAVVLAAWLLVAIARRMPAIESSTARLRLAPSYVIGSLAVMWCFERAAAWLG